MECESCGGALNTDAAFCSQCGTPAPEPTENPHASAADVIALNARIDGLEERLDNYIEDSGQLLARIPMLEDAERQHHRILNSSSLYTDMFGWRLLTMVGYGLLSGLLVSGILLAFALATGLLHR